MDNRLIIRGGEFFRKNSGASVEEEAALFRVLCSFLNSHGLSSHYLDEHRSSWDDFELRLADLTEDGAQVLRLGLSKWLARLDKGKSPADITPLTKALTSVRGKGQCEDLE